MGNNHTDVIVHMELPGVPKAILWLFGWKACKVCGITWPGMAWITLKSGFAESTVRSAIAWLEERGYLVVYYRPPGGRGFATEYSVIPTEVPLMGKPCTLCASKLKPHPKSKTLRQA